MPTLPNQYKGLAAITGNVNTVVAGDAKGLTAIATASIKDGTLSALFTLLAETNTITLAAGWQVSQDNSTWYDFPVENNAALVVFGTGTAGADSAVSKVIRTSGFKGWKFIRPAIHVGVTTGTANDTYEVTPYWLNDVQF